MKLAVHESLRPQLEAYQAFLDAQPKVDERFRSKFRALADGTEGPRLLSLLEYFLSVAEVELESKVVLDAGCGTGVFSLIFILNRALRVEAFDAQRDNIESLRRFLQEFPLPINPRLEDVARTDLPNDSVDFVFCWAAISHIRDWSSFLREAARVLRPGGRILIADSHNGASRRVKREIYRNWQASEAGPFIAHEYDPAGGRNLPYLFRRWMIIRREFENLSDWEVFHMGLRTTGIGGNDLLEACREYARSREFPNRSYHYGDSQRRPENDQTNEEPVDPREVVAILHDSGVRARTLPQLGLTTSRWMPLLNQIAALTRPVSVRFCPGYVVVGSK